MWFLNQKSKKILSRWSHVKMLTIVKIILYMTHWFEKAKIQKRASKTTEETFNYSKNIFIWPEEGFDRLLVSLCLPPGVVCLHTSMGVKKDRWIWSSNLRIRNSYNLGEKCKLLMYWFDNFGNILFDAKKWTYSFCSICCGPAKSQKLHLKYNSKLPQVIWNFSNLLEL